MITVEITAAIDAAGTLRTFYAADARFTSSPTDIPANTPFDGSLRDSGSIAVTAFGDGRTGGGTRLALGEMRLANANGQYDAWLDYSFAGRAVVIRRGEPGPYPASMRAIFTGTIEALTVNQAEVIVRLKDKQLMFDRKALSEVYAGSNVGPVGIEGTADDIKGQTKPRLFGYGFYLAPPCVNAPKLAYQPSASPLSAISAVYIDGVALTPGADYPDSTALMAAVLAPGPTYVTCLAEGLFRLAADPGGSEVTCDAVEGETDDERTGAQILRRIAIMGGVSEGEISVEDVAALDLANHAPLGIWITEDQTIASAMDAISGSLGAYYGFDGPGLLRMARLEAPAGSPVLQIDSYQVLGDRIERRPAADGDVPTWAYTIRHSRVWSPDGQVAGSVTAERRAYLANEYRAERAEAPEVKVQHILAAEQTADTLFVSAAPAAMEAARRLELHRDRRDFFDVPVADDVLNGVDLKIMDVVSLRSDRFGLGAGRLFRVLGILPQSSKNRTTLTLWG